MTKNRVTSYHIFGQLINVLGHLKVITCPYTAGVAQCRYHCIDDYNVSLSNHMNNILLGEQILIDNLTTRNPWYIVHLWYLHRHWLDIYTLTAVMLITVRSSAERRPIL